MIADWYEDGFKKEHNYREDTLTNPRTHLFIPARINLRATIEADKKIKVQKYPLGFCITEREVPSLFWCENLSSSRENTYVFETNYCTEFEDVLPIPYLKQIPRRLHKGFMRKVPGGISELADKLGDKEKDTRKLLRKFYDFVVNHLKPESPTVGKPVKQLLMEYQDSGYFYGNCKEARDFYVALCNAKGYPTKKVVGKTLGPGAHVWADVFVPVKEGYKLLPVDPALRHFGYLDPMEHIFFEYTPDIGITGMISEICSLVCGKGRSKYRLKIEPIETKGLDKVVSS